ncbi:MAG: glycosyltransferase family 4 protein [Cyanobacteria bacterium J06560_2]
MRKPVLTIFYQFNPWHSSIGGIQTIIRSFIKYAPPSIDLRLVGIGTGDPKMPAGQWHRAEFAGRQLDFFPLFDLPEDNTRRLVPTSVRYTLALLKRDLSSDFMHFHRLEPAMAALRWRGKDKLLYIHNDIHQKVKASGEHKSILWQRFPWLYFMLEKVLIEQFDRILSCNSDSTDLYKRLYPKVAERVSYVHNAVDDEIFYPVSPEVLADYRQRLAQELGLPHLSKFFLFAGRLHPQKDPLLLVQAIAKLNDPTVHLLIAGEGELTDALNAEIARLNLSQHVTMLGPVNQARLSVLYRAASAFVLSSVYEGLPVVALESLACGTPVITTRAGDTPNILTSHSGIICEQRTADTIANAMAQLLAHPEHYPQAACSDAVKPYKGRQVIAEIYEDLLRQWHQRASTIY